MPDRLPLTRPQQALAAVGRVYGQGWAEVDRLRARRARDFPAWPDWCFLPLQAAHDSVAGGRMPIELARSPHVAIFAALAAWRVSQGIYRFDPDVAAAVAATPLEGDLPTDLLYRLPEWCVYIETPGLTWGGEPLHGFWAHLDWELTGGPDELRLLLDTGDDPAAALAPRGGPTPLPLILGEGTLAHALERLRASGQRQLLAQGLDPAPMAWGPLDGVLAELAPMVALVLYLCAENAEIGDGTARPVRPEPTRTKRGPRLFPPQRVTAWDVGLRLGAALRRAEAVPTGEARGPAGPRARPRAHLRRAHWHTYRVGPERLGRRVHWVAPIPVNVADPDALPGTVRPVD